MAQKLIPKMKKIWKRLMRFYVRNASEVWRKVFVANYKLSEQRMQQILNTNNVSQKLPNNQTLFGNSFAK
jgi:hypothetical protein